MPVTTLATTKENISDTVLMSPIDEGTQAQSVPYPLQHLGIILWVSFCMPIAGSIYYLLGGKAPTDPLQQRFRLVGALIMQITALLVLGYVMRQRGQTWKQIGWDPEVRDIPRGLGLFAGANVLMYAFWIPVQYAYRAYAGHFLVTKSLTSIFGFGVSALSIAFICLNPFFEELIVRAFTISEVINMGRSRVLAVIVSVLVQMSYHLYQGLANVLALTCVFTIFSIYFARTRRIGPVIFAHACADALALVRGMF